MLVKKAEKEESVKNIISTLTELGEDSTIPKNVKTKLQNVQMILNREEDMPIQVNRCLDELELVSNDVNLQPYTRTQIWNIVTLLEKL